MQSDPACAICDRSFSQSGYLLRHLKAHESLLTADQLQHLKDRSGSLAQSADGSAPAEGAAPAEPTPFKCAICRRSYKYERAYEKHVAKHGRRDANRAADMTDQPNAADPKVIEAEIKQLVSILTQHRTTRPVLELLTPSALEDDLSVVYYQSHDAARRFEATQTLPTIELPQIKNKLMDFCLYQTMVEVRAFRDQQRQKVINKMFKNEKLVEGQCPICLLKFTDSERFMAHMPNCAKMIPYTCEYCETTFSNTMGKSRHMDTCIIKRNCANSPIKNPAEVIQNLRNAEELAFWLLSETLADPDISLLGKYHSRLPELIRKWSQRSELQHAEGAEGTEGTEDAEDAEEATST